MRVMIDTNVLISALLFPSQQMNTLIYKITTEHQLVLSSYVVEELLNVVRRKFKSKLGAVDLLLSQLTFELVYTPAQPKTGLFEIRDEKDYPVLYSAIVEDVDVFITGDRDFDGLGLEKPEIVTVAVFLENY
ncbi:twitching motility protein PilT [Desulfitobacterium hafniense]|uniref:Twitching motility protein PilT n=1 Tax=Desulfitobacterium hafniense TaxID=49338 RepID=A0A0W1JD33_DESHA|nr:putative toxin-antitoxin system toxin component, PIN family [Desulfitobacterium hafniense]KTE89517.1 twitching motility protein PilT [Desulfitobacterium hafniense]